MRLDFAPMEGITDAIYRQMHKRYFSGVDRYYTPFVSPTMEHRFTPRERRNVLPEHNQGLCVIPQILTKVPADFLWAAGELVEMGYREVNLNLGCPSGTVASKGKGSGMLANPDVLDSFLNEIFEKTPCAISVKTRLGIEKPEEFEEIMEVYNRYPIAELIIHPRVRKDFYRHPVRTEAFEAALAVSKNPVSYNGGLVTAADCAECAANYPQLTAIMIGQGLVSDPFLAAKIKEGATVNLKTLQTFHDELFETYSVQFQSSVNAMKRMKEIWIYLISMFDENKKHRKKLFKTKTEEEYRAAASAIFRELPLLSDSEGEW